MAHGQETRKTLRTPQNQTISAMSPAGPGQYHHPTSYTTNTTTPVRKFQDPRRLLVFGLVLLMLSAFHCPDKYPPVRWHEKEWQPIALEWDGTCVGGEEDDVLLVEGLWNLFDGASVGNWEGMFCLLEVVACGDRRLRSI